MPHLPQPLRQLRPLLLAGALVWLAGCDMATGVATQGLIHSYSKPALEPRDGYVVDHRHPARGHNSRVHFLILHYTDENQADSLRALTGPRVSSHYLLPLPTRRLQGSPVVFQLVPEPRRAWHAGASRWGNRIGLNDTSIGIEIVNQGPDQPWVGSELEPPEGVGWMPYPDSQIEALIALSRDIIERHGIEARHVLAHSDVAPTRKLDPGPAFPWKRLHDAGIGAWPEPERVAHYAQRFDARQRIAGGSLPSIETVQRALRAWGYDIEVSGVLDDATRATLRAFQLHFRPADFSGNLDADTCARLWALLERYLPEALATLAEPQPAEPQPAAPQPAAPPAAPGR
ncbi:N-acetylmuramoyl-L-alanine amidase [Halomonas sp. DP8Y7-3]|uniref:N-acetylmuramoyl-L-alanine amidase n=1 Tax=Halomonas sp. DP8Y7-3 TaxID=2859079 RepID=UPI0021BD29F5|nr:N-acetylmuramoyl-L-alanine amidase [Halomonas sp. DP8Y7-3]